MPRDIGFYRRQHKIMHDRIDDLEAQLQRRDHQEVAAVRDAVEPLQRLVAELEAAAAFSTDDHRATIDQHDRAHAFRDGQIADLQRQLDAWRTKAEAAEPAIAEARSLAVDAMALVQRVTGDIRRRADQDQAAALNRRALAAALCIPAAEPTAK